MRLAGGVVLGLCLMGADRAAPQPDGDGDAGVRKVIDPLPDEKPAVPDVHVKAFNEIDRFIAARWKAAGVRPAPVCDDYDFVRRVYLDLAGVIPTEEQIRSFLRTGYRRRRKLIDALLDSSRYADHWAVLWGDLLRERTNVRGADPFAMRDVIRGALSADKPYDVWVRDLLTASGTARDDPAVTFMLRNRVDANELTIAVTQVFLGVQLKCAQCHDHPFEAWEQSDFRGMAGFFAGTRRERAFVDEVRQGDRVVRRPIDAVFDVPSGGTGRFLTGASSSRGMGREGLAELVVGRDNPYFARAAVNRLWARLFGAGLVDPPDAFSVENPPSHPKLLDWLAIEFVEHGYDLKHMLRLMCNSRTYQLASYGGRRPGDVPEEARFFYRMPVRRMTAEQMYDSILVSCGLVDTSRRSNRPAIETRYPAAPQSFLATFAAHDRDTIHERSAEMTIPQALALLNGRFINRAVAMHDTHPVRLWLEAGYTPKSVVTRLFLQTLGREPQSKELGWALEVAGSEKGWSDLHWALINTREFSFIR